MFVPKIVYLVLSTHEFQIGHPPRSVHILIKISGLVGRSDDVTSGIFMVDFTMSWEECMCV